MDMMQPKLQSKVVPTTCGMCYIGCSIKVQVENGVVVAIEETLEASELPPMVEATLDQRFPGWQIVLAEKLTDEGVVTYNLEIRHSGRKTKVLLDAEGNELKR